MKRGTDVVKKEKLTTDQLFDKISNKKSQISKQQFLEYIKKEANIDKDQSETILKYIQDGNS